MKKQLASVLVLVSSVSLVSAASISVNFNSERDGAAEIGTGESAGAPGFVTTGWNNFNGLPATGPLAQTTADVDGPNAGSLSDDSGAVVGTTISWAANNSWNTNNGTTNGDNKLMNGYIDNSAANGITISITGVTYPIYRVVAYIGSDGNGRTGSIGISGGDTFSYSTNSNLTGGLPGGYVQTTDTGAGNPSANFAVWEGQTAADFTLTVTRGSNNSGIHGIQIIEVPEPTTPVLLGMCGMVLLVRRRRLPA